MQKMKSLQLVLFALLLDNITWGQSQNGNAIRKAESVSIHPIVNSINQFGFRLSTKMMESSSDNIVISPTSVAGLLSMTLLGSVGKTYDELAAALGFSQDILMNRNNHKEFGELLNTIDGINPASTTLSASAVAVDARARLRNEYRDYLNRIYKAEVINVNFEDSNETKKIINEWVCRHTEGHINEFLKQPLHFDTKVVLLNVLYFSGQWAYPFLPEYTRNMSFVTPRGVVNAELMLNSGEFDYVFSPNLGVHMIALPYNDSATTMYVLKPFWPKRLSLPELMRRLDHEIINNLINEMTTTKVVIRFPKMQIESKIDLTNTLKALGLTSMFSQGIANFALMVDSKQFQNVSEVQILSRINSDDETAVTDVKEILNNLPNPKIYVDSVIHNVKLTIDEFGTEAAAVTTGILARTAELFYADSPFFMFIRDERTKLITFSATIFDPII